MGPACVGSGGGTLEDVADKHTQETDDHAQMQEQIGVGEQKQQKSGLLVGWHQGIDPAPHQEIQEHEGHAKQNWQSPYHRQSIQEATHAKPHSSPEPNGGSLLAGRRQAYLLTAQRRIEFGCPVQIPAGPIVLALVSIGHPAVVVGNRQVGVK